MAPIVQGKVSLTMPRHTKNINQPVRPKPQHFAARQGSRNMLDASERSTNSFCSLFVVEDAMLFAVSIVAVLEQDARILNLLAVSISAKDSDVLVIARNDCSTTAMVEIRMTNDQPPQSLAGEADAAKIFRDPAFRMGRRAA